MMARTAPALLAIFALGCPPPDAAQVALTSTSRALVEVDAAIAPAYAEAAALALEASETLEEYRAAVSGWDDAEAALRGARAALLSGQDALDFWRTSSGTSATFLTAIPALIGALRDIVRRLPLLGVDVPQGLLDALELLDGLGGGDHG